MAPYFRGAGARKHQLTQSAPHKSKAKPGRPANDLALPFKLLIDREGLCALSANSKTLELIDHQVETYTGKHVDSFRVRKDASGRYIDVVLQQPADAFLLDRIAALGTQLK